MHGKLADGLSGCKSLSPIYNVNACHPRYNSDKALGAFNHAGNLTLQSTALPGTVTWWIKVNFNVVTFKFA